MDIPLRVEVRCSDEVCGKSVAIIVDPNTEQVTHIVIQTAGSDYLVPIDAISESAPDHIQLRWSKAELEAAEPFERLETLSADEQMMQMQAMSGSYVGWSAGGMPGEYMPPVPISSTMEVEQIWPFSGSARCIEPDLPCAVPVTLPYNSAKNLSVS